eukprot:scaffold12787_cov15-Prasinocladus_malaysianus.AAC.1
MRHGMRSNEPLLKRINRSGMDQNRHWKGTYGSSSQWLSGLVALGFSMAALHAVGWNVHQGLSIFEAFSKFAVR